MKPLKKRKTVAFAERYRATVFYIHFFGVWE